MSISPESYAVIDTHVAFEHAWIRLRVDRLEHHGWRRPYFYLESPVEAVATVALTSDGQVVLTRQYRHPLRQVILDLPAGRSHPGEAPRDAARRELEEETGYQAGNLIPLGRYNPFPGSLKVTAHIFFASALSYAGPHLDEGEELEVVLMPFGEVLDLVLRGELIDGSLQMGVLLAAQKGLVG